MTEEYEIALAFLKKTGSLAARTARQERVLADLASQGFARKEGNAYVYAPPVRLPAIANHLFEIKRIARPAIPSPRQIVLGVGMFSLVLLLAYLPWTYTLNFHNGYATVQSEKPAGYAFFFKPPAPEHHAGGVRIDFGRLVLSLLFLAAITGLGLFLTRGRKNPTAPPPGAPSSPDQPGRA